MRELLRTVWITTMKFPVFYHYFLELPFLRTMEFIPVFLGIHLITKLPAISLQASKFTKNEFLHTYF